MRRSGIISECPGVPIAEASVMVGVVGSICLFIADNDHIQNHFGLFEGQPERGSEGIQRGEVFHVYFFPWGCAKENLLGIGIGALFRDGDGRSLP